MSKQLLEHQTAHLRELLTSMVAYIDSEPVTEAVIIGLLKDTKTIKDFLVGAHMDLIGRYPKEDEE